MRLRHLFSLDLLPQELHCCLLLLTFMKVRLLYGQWDDIRLGFFGEFG